jgi:hypothetical protein
VAKVYIGRGRVYAQFHPERASKFQLGPKFIPAKNLGAAGKKWGKLV